MRRLFGHLAPAALLGVLLATTMGSEALAGPIDITVTINDVTTSTVTVFTITKGGAFDASDPGDPNSLISNGTFELATTLTGVHLSGLTASSNNPGTPFSSVLNITGTAQLVLTTTDHFIVTIDTSQTFFTLPPASTSATLAESHSFTANHTGGFATDSQTFTSFYDPGNALYGTGAGTTPVGPNTLPIPNTLTAPQSDGSATLTNVVAPYVTPYSLTNRMVIDLQGIGSIPNATNLFTGSTTLEARGVIPEPSSIVLMLTSLPLPIMLVGLLNRARRTKA